METKVCLKYFVYDCLWKHFLLLNWPKLNFFDKFDNSKAYYTVLT